jgi:glycerol kinase
VRDVVGGLLLRAGDAVGGRARRGLTGDERSVLAAVFRNGLDLDGIVVVPALAGLLGLSRRPVTLGTAIHLKGHASPGLLVHEAVHVWQYHRLGARYVLDAIRAQCSRTGYDWRAAGTAQFAALNVEAQAQFLQDLVTTPAVGTAYPALAADALASVRTPSTPSTT